MKSHIISLKNRIEVIRASFDNILPVSFIYILNTIGFTFVAIWTFPLYVKKVTSGFVDESYIYALNNYSIFDINLGVDVFCTYGRWGFLLNPIGGSNHWLISNFFFFTCYGSFLWINAKLAFWEGVKHKYLLISCLIFFSFYTLPLGVHAEYYLLFVFWLSLLYFGKTKQLHSYVICCILMLVSYFAKLSLFVALCGNLGLFLFGLWVFEKEIDWKLWMIWIVHLCCIPLILLVVGRGKLDLFEILLAQKELLKGYPDSEVLVHNPDWILIFTLLLQLIAVFLGVFLLNRKSLKGLAVVIFVLWISFKYAYVRFDPFHEWVYFSTSVFVSGTFLFFSELKKDFWKYGKYSILCFLLILPSAIVLAPSVPKITNFAKYRILHSIPQTVSYIKNPFDEIPRVDPKLVEMIDEASYSIYPNDLYLLHSFREEQCHNFISFPVLQGYVAWTKYLEGKSISFLKSENPSFLIISYDFIDHRYPFLDAPRIWKYILSSYRFVETFGNYHLFAFEEAEVENMSSNSNAIDVYKFDFDKPMNVDLGNQKQIRIDINKRVGGVIKSLLYAPGIVKMKVYYSDDSSVEGRIIPSLVGQFFDISLLDANYMFSNHKFANKNPGIVKIEFTTNRVSDYEQVIVSFR